MDSKHTPGGILSARIESAHYDSIKAAAEATTSVGQLRDIGQYQVGPLRYLRFNYTTGDAAGQNMTGKATLAACEWIRAHHADAPTYLLSGSMDTDKKHSHINASAWNLLGCYGAGNVYKFAEICAAVVLAGEVSLASAVVHGDWVSAHDALGRNRP
jgi:hydroxymethylglutaryl-CoA reductase